MSFVPIFTTHSPHIYFAFILHFFMFSLVISALTKALGWARSHMTCKSLTHVIYAVKQRVCGNRYPHAFPTFRVLLQMWKDVGSAPALKACGWFWLSSTIYRFSFWKWEWGLQIRSWVFPLPQLKCCTMHKAFLLSLAVWKPLCRDKNSVCPYTPYWALLSRSNLSNLVVKNCGSYIALAWKHWCQEKSRCPLLPAFVIIRSMLCSGVICSIVHTLLCRLFLRR